MAQEKTKVNKVEPTMNQITFVFLNNTFFKKSIMRKHIHIRVNKKNNLKCLHYIQ